ncbi:RimJ/RimL family protein N-acetyltransferase [Alicyclobacillus tengchongensis]|uniref:RimJ/RimL family protein N-acetyltransferase n=3 Tax=Alicyclobacillus tolerans TaxID=90970 RepID=A0ABT9LU92_9BACL|nr:RimJ/RimL family protein N-acetyltransferase [Alicyclobacillus tengchongensis]SHL10218.1 Acetyltransferase (GNAT) domain-containing protein [Alicyclobacillus montanus]
MPKWEISRLLLRRWSKSNILSRSLINGDPGVMPSVEIDWRLGRSFWGKGSATEAVKETLRFGFKNCGLNKIMSICQISNIASECVMQKLGMYFKREIIDSS